MNYKAILTEAIDDGLDRQNLFLLKKRFLQINASRLARTRSALTDRQQMFLDLLPLLLHVNHPMLPGYLSRTTPAGICDYEPEKEDLASARVLARSFQLNATTTPTRDIEGLFLMGSVGTVAHSEQSDFDIWVCYRPGLPQEKIAELDQKCRRVAAWAAELRLEAHFFPMDYEAFKLGQLSALNAESSGSAQRLLLLDEFYRTALHLAGRMPLWWFVPAAAEPKFSHYAHTLLHKRFLKASTVLDFGGVAVIPNGEFIGAGIWQLYKAIESPYKSVLKLLLLEAYVSQYPDIEPLSLIYKKKVFHGQLDVDELDSYVMIYRRIEAYLSGRQQLRRLELARRCLYFKINKPLSKPITGKTKSWQRKLLERLTQEWDWSTGYIRLLDEREQWKAGQVTEERSLLVNELNHSYRFLSAFANARASERAISEEELTILGRKLQAAFERRPGKIEWINPGISADLSEPLLLITEDVAENGGARWCAASRPMAGTDSGAVFRQSQSLTELLLWCQYNGIIHTGTQFDMTGSSIDSSVVRRLLTSLQNWLPTLGQTPSHEVFQRAATPTHVLLLINVGIEPQAHLYQQGMQRMSSRTDALRYSGFDDNLVMSIDCVVRNSWQEISCTRFEGDKALLLALEDYLSLSLSLPRSQQAPTALTIECIGTNHASIIAQRVRELFSDISACYHDAAPALNSAGTRYVFAMAGSFYSLQSQGPRLTIEHHRNETALLRWLGQEQRGYSSLVVDKHAQLKHPLQLIAANTQPGAVNIFFTRARSGMRLYVVDECGSFLYFTAMNHTDPLIPLHRFLRAITQRRARGDDELFNSGSGATVLFFEIGYNQNKQLQCLPREIATEALPGVLIDVKAIVSCDSEGHYRYSFYCDQEEFSHLQYGTRLLAATAAHIRSCRRAPQDYPVYLGDLDLGLCRYQLAPQGKLQTSHYLRLKQELEQALNNA